MSNSQKISSFSKTIVADANGNTLSLNLPALNVSGQTALGPVANVRITGGANGQVLSTNGGGNLSWTTPQTPNSQPGGSNTSVQYNNNGVLEGSGDFLYNNVTKTVTQPNVVVNGTATHGGITNLGTIANVKITGGTTGQTIVTDGTGNLVWGQGGGTGSVKQVDTTGSGLGFQLTGGPITEIGTVNLGVPTAVDLRNSLSIGDVANKFFNGASTEFLNGVGEWTQTPRGIDIAVDSIIVAPVSNVINFVDNNRPNNRIHFDVLNANVEATIDPLTGIDIQEDIVANGFTARDITTGKTVTLRAYETVGNQVYDLPSEYPQANLQILAANVSDNGFSKTTWINLQNAQPGINFTVFQSGNGQQFVNSNLETFTSNAYAAVFKNGILLRPSEYVITGTTLIVNTPLNIDDTIDVLPTSGSMAGGTGGGGGGGGQPVGLTGQIQYNDDGQFGASPAMSFNSLTGTTSLTYVQSNLITTPVANATTVNSNTVVSNTANITTGNITELTSNTVVSNTANITTGNITALSSNTLVSNQITGNTVSATTLTSGNSTVTGTLSVTGNTNVGNLTASGTTQVQTLNGVNATLTNSITVVQTANLGNIIAGNANITNLQVPGSLSAAQLSVGTIAVGNIVGNNITATETVSANNITATNEITAIGNINAGNLNTDGALYANLDSYFSNDVFVNGNLNITGNINTTDLSNVTIANATIALGTGDTPPLTVDDGKDRGLLLYYFDNIANTQKVAFTGWDIVDKEMVVARDVTDNAGFITYNQLANSRADYFTGNLRFGNSTIKPGAANIEFAVAGNTVTVTDTGFVGNLKTGNIQPTTAGGNITVGTDGDTATLTLNANVVTLSRGVINTPNVANVFLFYNANVANINQGRANTTTRMEGNLVVLKTANLANANITTATISNTSTTTLTVTGNTNLGDLGNIKINGGIANYVLKTDGTGNLSWTAQTGGGGNTAAQYLYATRSGTNQTISSGTWANVDVIMNGVAVNSGITYNSSTGTMTLTGGVTYRVTAQLGWNAGAPYAIAFKLVNSDTGAQIGTQAETLSPSGNFTNPPAPVLDVIFTPATTSNYRLRVSITTASTGENIRADLGSFLTVMALSTGPVVAQGGWTKVTNWNFGGTTTAPTSATAATRHYVWSVTGKIMTIKGFYNTTSNSGATAGSGEYLLSLPGGYQIDTTTTGTAAVGSITGIPVGTGSLDVNNARSMITPIVFDSTRIKFTAWTIAEGGGTGSGQLVIGSAYQALNATARYNLYFTAEIPIL